MIFKIGAARLCSRATALIISKEHSRTPAVSSSTVGLNAAASEYAPRLVAPADSVAARDCVMTSAGASHLGGARAMELSPACPLKDRESAGVFAFSSTGASMTDRICIGDHLYSYRLGASRGRSASW
jgi:hypothetical protein